jgi:hypothetical protein
MLRVLGGGHVSPFLTVSHLFRGVTGKLLEEVFQPRGGTVPYEPQLKSKFKIRALHLLAV